jgi:UDP-GlcNAc3NAcA epimerase
VKILKVVSIIGARPQFIKCAPLSRELRKSHKEILVHTGQHYDHEMSDIFFEELEIPTPDYNLGIGSGSHGEQTGKLLIEIEVVLKKELPDLVLVYGDTNSTLAGALAAVKLHIPIAHVEAGLRSFDRTMPEEINRIITDHISDYLLCPTQTAVDNLAAENVKEGVFLTGDIMADALAYNQHIAEKKSRILENLSLQKKKYLVMTVHRPGNTDSKKNMASILAAVSESKFPVIFPTHPRTRKYLQEFGLWETMPGNIVVTESIGYLDMIRLMENASKILTDSGGIQKEAFMLGIPCITLRDNTEWVETLKDGWNVLVGGDRKRIVEEVKRKQSILLRQENLFGDGNTAERIVRIFSEPL